MLTCGVSVVVPAHDEQDLLPACLDSLRRAAAQPGVPPVRVLVVADTCSDASVEVTRAGGAEVLEVALRSAGGSRRAGFDLLLATSVVPPDAHWLATTDADSRVPPDWFTLQLALRSQGADAVVGTVQVDDWSGHGADVASRFADHYAWTGHEHPHVHGANLSLSARAYLSAGGLPPLDLAEDHALVDALVALGLHVARPTSSPVVTSARTDARCSGGFGDLLASLGAPAA